MVLPLARATALTPASSSDYNNAMDEIERVIRGTFGDLTRVDRPVFKVERTSNLSIPDTTDTTVTWQSAVEDPDDMWDPAFPTRLNVMRGGVWLLIAQERYLASPSGSRAGKIMLNGTNVFANSLASAKSPSQNDGEGTTLQIITFQRVVQGDALYLNTWQNSGGAQNLIWKGHVVSTQIYGFGGTWFAGLWLGP